MGESRKAEPAPRPEKRYLLRLVKNHQPKPGVEIVMAAPAPYAGVGQDGRLWAGTLARFARSEAQRLLDAGIAVRADALE